jgi:hypothetical protein
MSFRLPEAVAAAIRASGGTEYLVALVERDIARREGRSIGIELGHYQDAWLAESGDATAYVATVLDQRLGAVLVGLEHLETTGWTRDEIRIAAALAEGRPPEGMPIGSWVAVAMVEDERIAREQQDRLGLPLLGGHAGQVGIALDRWHELARRCREHEPTARAVAAVSAEWWADHRGVSERLAGSRP